ncbi:hypothetical protein BGZ65_002874, partial [Modicella reniformis]
IEEENDPRNFVEQGEDNGDEEGPELQEPYASLTIDDMVDLLQLMFEPRSPRRRRTRTQINQQPQLLPLPGQFPNITSSTSLDQTLEIRDEDVEMTDAEQETDQPPPPAQQENPLASLLERLGLELHLGSDGDVEGLFNTYGNPGDYVFSQRALDDVITRMMEADGRLNGPVAAPDEVIESIPRHTLTREELDAKIECSVCKDEFAQEDNCLQLKCNHIFHEDCIKPWLKTSGTCPTCRFALVPQEHPQDEEEEEESDEDDGDEGDERDGGNLPWSTAVGRRGRGSREGSGTLAAIANGTRLPGSFPSSRRS